MQHKKHTIPMKYSARYTVIMLALILPTSVFAGEFDGFCMPADADGERYPITNNTYETMESTCTLSEPVSVKDLDASLYYVTCKGDWGRKKERTVVMRFQDPASNKIKVLMADKWGPVILEKCK